MNTDSVNEQRKAAESEASRAAAAITALSEELKAVKKQLTKAQGLHAQHEKKLGEAKAEFAGLQEDVPRLEGEVALPMLLERLPGLRLLEGPRPVPFAAIRRLPSLSVAWDSH